MYRLGTTNRADALTRRENVGIIAAWTVIPVQLSCVATTDNQAKFSAGVIRAANSLQINATLTVNKYGLTVCKIIRQLNTIYSTTHCYFH